MIDNYESGKVVNKASGNSYSLAIDLVVDEFDVVFFFQAEDGIRDRNVTGVQTCALPISVAWAKKNNISQPVVALIGNLSDAQGRKRTDWAWKTIKAKLPNAKLARQAQKINKIGRASCREREYK